MKQIIFLILILLAVAVNESVFVFFKIQGIGPNLLALLALISVFFGEDNDYLWLAFVCGLFLDFFTPAFPGAFSIGLPLSCLAVWFLDKKVLAFEKKLGYTLFGLLAFMVLLQGFAIGFLWLVFKAGFSESLVLNREFFIKFVFSFFYNAVLFYPVYGAYIFAKDFSSKFKTRNLF